MSQTIRRVEVYEYELTYIHGRYAFSGGRVLEALTSNVVRLITDDGLDGYGEVCPAGPVYLPAHAAGAHAALRELAPAVVGLDATNLSQVSAAMDSALLGHAYAKSAIDIACWDVLGKTTGLSVSQLLGGRLQESFPLYVAVPLGSAEEMAEFLDARRSEGIHRFQLKIGSDPYEDAARTRRIVEMTGPEDVIIADANGGWRLQDAVIAVRELEAYPASFSSSRAHV